MAQACICCPVPAPVRSIYVALCILDKVLSLKHSLRTLKEIPNANQIENGNSRRIVHSLHGPIRYTIEYRSCGEGEG